MNLKMFQSALFFSIFILLGSHCSFVDYLSQDAIFSNIALSLMESSDESPLKDYVEGYYLFKEKIFPTIKPLNILSKEFYTLFQKKKEILKYKFLLNKNIIFSNIKNETLFHTDLFNETELFFLTKNKTLSEKFFYEDFFPPYAFQMCHENIIFEVLFFYITALNVVTCSNVSEICQSLVLKKMSEKEKDRTINKKSAFLLYSLTLLGLSNVSSILSITSNDEACLDIKKLVCSMKNRYFKLFSEIYSERTKEVFEIMSFSDVKEFVCSKNDIAKNLFSVCSVFLFSFANKAVFQSECMKDILKTDDYEKKLLCLYFALSDYNFCRGAFLDLYVSKESLVEKSQLQSLKNYFIGNCLKSIEYFFKKQNRDSEKFFNRIDSFKIFSDDSREQKSLKSHMKEFFLNFVYYSKIDHFFSFCMCFESEYELFNDLCKNFFSNSSYFNQYDFDSIMKKVNSSHSLSKDEKKKIIIYNILKLYSKKLNYLFEELNKCSKDHQKKIAILNDDIKELETIINGNKKIIFAHEQCKTMKEQAEQKINKLTDEISTLQCKLTIETKRSEDQKLALETRNKELIKKNQTLQKMADSEKEQYNKLLEELKKAEGKTVKVQYENQNPSLKLDESNNDNKSRRDENLNLKNNNIRYFKNIIKMFCGFSVCLTFVCGFLYRFIFKQKFSF